MEKVSLKSCNASEIIATLLVSIPPTITTILNKTFNTKANERFWLACL